MALHIGIEHGSTGFARGQVFVFERAVDVDGSKCNTLIFKGFNHFIMGGPEGGFGE